MKPVRSYRAIEFHQVCAIARLVLLREPTMNDSEWKESTKVTAAKQGYDEPAADMLSRAMTQVEHALKRTMGPRPTDLSPVRVQPRKDPPELTKREWSLFAATVRGVLARSSTVLSPSNVESITRETLDISEHAALDQFYREAGASDRIAALRRFAEIAIVRPADWDVQAIRGASAVHNLRASECFVCRTEQHDLAWHHVIQIQHGGSNLLRNRVALCGACHADVHPWLPRVARSKGDSWVRVGQMAPAVSESQLRTIFAKQRGEAS